MKHAIGFAIAAALGVGMVAGTSTVELQARTSLVSFTPVVYSSLIPQFARRGGAVDDASVDPGAPTSAYNMDVPLAYYNLSFTLSKRTGGITPPVQARIFAYMGLALYESVVEGMPHNDRLQARCTASDHSREALARSPGLSSRAPRWPR